MTETVLVQKEAENDSLWVFALFFFYREIGLKLHFLFLLVTCHMWKLHGEHFGKTGVFGKGKWSYDHIRFKFHG